MLFEIVKRQRKKILVTGFIVVCLGGLVYSVVNIAGWRKDVDSNNEIKEETGESVAVDNEEYKVDFSALKAQNSDTIAYLKVKGTEIDYVVVQGEDNDYYLKHNFKKEENVAGWVFGDYRNRFDGSDKNLIIYGHNIREGSMFGTLKDTLEKEWQENEENREIIFITEEGRFRYQVFSTYETKPEDYYIRTDFKGEEEFSDFIGTLRSRSNYDYGVEVGGEDKILTLSSCVGNGEGRVVLHAKLV